MIVATSPTDSSRVRRILAQWSEHFIGSSGLAVHGERSLTLAVPQLFVLVSTGQNVANLPPVLEHAEVGDWIVWIESDLAQRQDWAGGTRQVLKQRGLRIVEASIAVRQINDPVQVAAACRGFLDGWKHDAIGEPAVHTSERTDFRAFLALAHRGLARTFLVCNGGNKLTPIGLLQGWAALHPIFLYGDDTPAACWTFSDGLDRSPTIRPYQRTTLDLPEILATRRHFVLNHGEAERFWPGPLRQDLALEPFGKKEEYTYYLHQQHYDWALSQSGEEFPTYDALARLLDATRIDRWKRALRTLSGAGPRYADNDAILREVYQASMKLANDGIRARGRAELTQPAAKISDAFEHAVAARVYAWLEETKHPAVQSAWRKVCVAPEGQQIPSAEFDVLLVLKNGILWHLECKSATVDLKDLDAKLLNLQKAASQLARLAVCAPMLTRCSAKPWFAALHALREKIENLSRTPFVPFTMPDQPASYTLLDKDGSPVIWDCPSLESQLEKFLKPFASF